MTKVDGNEAHYLEDCLASDIRRIVSDEAFVDPLMASYGWAGEPPVALHRIAERYGVDASALRNAQSKLVAQLNERWPDPLIETFNELYDRLPCAVPTLGAWLADNGYTRSSSFSVEGLFEAADVYGIDLPIKAVSTNHTKWLVDIDGPDLDVSFIDEVVGKALSIAPQWGIIDVNHFTSLLEIFLKPGREELAWAAIDACPELAPVAGTGFAISKHPQEDATIVLRLDRLLAFLGAVPLSITLKQITRDGNHGVLPVEDADTLEAFVRHCAYYSIEDGDVVPTRDLVVDEELSAREKPVVLALVERPAGATISEIAAATPMSVDDDRVREVVASSPLIVALPNERYALIDPSMYEALLEEDEEVSTPEPITPVTPTTERVVDLAGLGHTGTYWWAMYAGPIPEGQLQGALQNDQKYMPILNPASDKCLGMVRTSRVYNKNYRGGIPTVLANDKGLKGKELPRLVPRDTILEALSEAPFIFYNDPTKSGQESWGIVQRQDIGWN